MLLNGEAHSQTQTQDFIESACKAFPAQHVSTFHTGKRKMNTLSAQWRHSEPSLSVKIQVTIQSPDHSLPKGQPCQQPHKGEQQACPASCLLNQVKDRYQLSLTTPFISLFQGYICVCYCLFLLFLRQGLSCSAVVPHILCASGGQMLTPLQGLILAAGTA